jgi:hypothetical protein
VPYWGARMLMDVWMRSCESDGGGVFTEVPVVGSLSGRGGGGSRLMEIYPTESAAACVSGSGGGRRCGGLASRSKKPKSYLSSLAGGAGAPDPGKAGAMQNVRCCQKCCFIVDVSPFKVARWSGQSWNAC